ncbi:MAG: CSLREA domain-containing protein, partial [Anaerolineae bacterium]
MSTTVRRALLRFSLLFSIAVLILMSIITPAQPVFAAAYTVTKTTDSNDGVCDADCSLREAIAAANSNTDADTISFGVGGTIQLTLGTLIIANDTTLTIEGGSVTISGNNTFRIFEIGNNATVFMKYLTITGGNEPASGGGAIYHHGAYLTLYNCILRGNSAGAGGAIRTISDMSMVNTTVSGNTATSIGGGGGIEAAGIVSMYNSLFSGNSAPLSPSTADCTIYIGGIDGTYNLLETDDFCFISGSPLTTTPNAQGNFIGIADLDSVTLIPNPGSPAIDRGSPGFSVWCLATDYNGIVRPIDGDGDTIAVCDVGALEAPLLPATDTPTSTATSTATDTATNTPTSTPTDTATNTPTSTPTDTATDTPTSTPTDTATDTPTSTGTQTATDTPTDTPTATVTDTATDTPTPTVTSTATDTPTDTPTATVTDTATDTPTATVTGTATDTPSVTPTIDPSLATLTPTATNTGTPTVPAPGVPCRNPLPIGSVQGRVIVTLFAYYDPNPNATSDVVIPGGTSWWIIDTQPGYYRIWITCEATPVWVPVFLMTP